MFDEKDLQQIREHGLTPEQAETQLENFRRGFPFLNVVRAASPGDGVLVVGAAEADAAVERYEKESAGLGVVKFVPASGAATRMFKELFEFVNDGKRGKGIDTLLENIRTTIFKVVYCQREFIIEQIDIYTDIKLLRFFPDKSVSP